jgi:hypothetical protein
MNPLFIILPLAALVAVRPLLRQWRQYQTRRAWSALAPRLELSLVTGAADGRILTGRYQGHPVDVVLSPDGMAQLRMEAQATLPAGLHLSRQEPGAERLKLRGMQDIQIGVPALDAAFIIQGKNPAAIIRLLREPGVSEALLALQADSPQAMITENEVVAPIDSAAQEEPCRRALRALARLTSTLEQVAGQQEALAATAREQSRREALARQPAPAPVQPEAPAAPAPVQAEPEAPTPPPTRKRERPDSVAIRDEFVQRTSMYALIGQYPIWTGFALILLGKLVKHRVMGFEPYTWQFLGIGSFLVGLVGTIYSESKLLYCPACERSVTQISKEQQQRRPELRVQARRPRITSLVACPHCGVRLR